LKPEIIIGVDPGKHNQDMTGTLVRLEREGAYKDMSTILIIPCIGSVPVKVVSSWWNMYFPPNQKVIKMYPTGMEVGAAYSECIEMILNHPDLSKYKYIMTLESDNVPQPDAAVRLLQQMDAHPEYACIGGLYYTKGISGQPQCWGDISDPVLNFRPVPPRPNELIEVNGTGMGCNIFRLDMFRDERMRKPWFKTTADQKDGCFTQDLYFWVDAKKNGYRCAIDCGCLVGHYEQSTDITW
jgi:hypothetical protein